MYISINYTILVITYYFKICLKILIYTYTTILFMLQNAYKTYVYLLQGKLYAFGLWPIND